MRMPFRTIVEAYLMDGVNYQGRKRVVFNERQDQKNSDLVFTVLFDAESVNEFNRTQDKLLIIQTSEGLGYIHEHEYPIGECTIDTETDAKVFLGKDVHWFISLGLTQDLRELAKPWIKEIKNGK